MESLAERIGDLAPR